MHTARFSIWFFYLFLPTRISDKLPFRVKKIFFIHADTLSHSLSFSLTHMHTNGRYTHTHKEIYTYIHMHTKHTYTQKHLHKQTHTHTHTSRVYIHTTFVTVASRIFHLLYMCISMSHSYTEQYKQPRNSQENIWKYCT